MKNLERLCRALSLAALLTMAAGTEQPASLPTEELGPGLHRIEAGEAGCVLVYDTAEGRLLVDTADEKAQPALFATLRQLGERPVRWVISTHYHADHLGGNAALRAAGAVLVGHANLAREARKDLVVEEWAWHRKPAAEEALPQLEIYDRTDLHLGDRRVEILPAPAAHTDTDLVVWFPDANAVHIGDILEIGGPPFIDQRAGGSFEGMLAAIDAVLARADTETLIVPGHGAVVHKPELEAYRHMLVDVSAKVAAAIAAGTPPMEILDSRPAEAYEDRLGGAKPARRFVKTLYLDQIHSRGADD